MDFARTSPLRALPAPGPGAPFGSIVLLGLVSAFPALGQLNLVALNPSNEASNVCYDTTLQITFDSVPKVAAAGFIRIYSSANPAVPVDVIDLASGNLREKTFPGDAQPFSVYSVLVEENTATILPHAGVLTSNQSYYVTIDDGVFTDGLNVPSAGINDASTWTFTTKPSGPVDPANLIVAADGTGDFATVQGAVNAVPGGNLTPTLISIRNGNYVEIVNVSGKHNILFRGESRDQTIVGYANNANIAPGGTTHARMAFKVNGNDIAIDNLTVTNRTPNGGSQAEALMIETDIERFIANNVTIASFQDTILANTSGTQGYFNNSLIQGNTDFIWGGGNIFFTNCEIRCVSTGSVITQPRTNQGSNGMSFVNCRLTRAPGVTNCRFARPLGYRYSSVAFIRCLIDTHMSDWDTSLLFGRGGVKNPELRWWEHGNSNLTATAAVEYSGHQIGVASDDPRLEAAENSLIWLYGWEPRLRPNIITQPRSQGVVSGQSISLSVHATGIPEPGYRWLKDGTNLVGETESTLWIADAQADDAGDYSVVVSNVAGDVTSMPGTLTVVENPIPATIGSPALMSNGDFGFGFTGLSGQPFSIWGTNVALSPVTGTWTLLSNGVFEVGPVDFIDAEAPNLPLRFYHVTVP